MWCCMFACFDSGEWKGSVVVVTDRWIFQVLSMTFTSNFVIGCNKELANIKSNIWHCVATSLGDLLGEKMTPTEQLMSQKFWHHKPIPNCKLRKQSDCCWKRGSCRTNADRMMNGQSYWCEANRVVVVHFYAAVLGWQFYRGRYVGSHRQYPWLQHPCWNSVRPRGFVKCTVAPPV